MGTPCLTRIFDNEGDELCSLYRTCDGYVDTHGKELAEFMDGFKIVDGLPLGDNTKKIANGSGCFAAQLVTHFKTKPGEFYLQSKNFSDDKYTYLITVLSNGLMIEVHVDDETVFSGNVPAFKHFVSNYVEE